MIAQQSLASCSLVELYEHLLRRSSPEALVVEHIRRRGELAGALVRPWVLELAEQDLEEYQDRLHAAAAPNPALDPAADAAERERARVQLATIEAEMSRRVLFAEAVSDAQVYAPGRNDLVGYLFGAARELREAQQGAGTRADRPIVAVLPALEAAVRDALATRPPGRLVVAAALRAANTLAHPQDGPEAPWVRTAIALELLTREGGWMGMSPPVDAITRAQAVRAKRMFYAEVRHDARHEDPRWPLDLSGATIAQVLEEAERASAAWAQERLPVVDLDLYLEPVRREEPGRPTPHPSVEPEAVLRERVAAYEGLGSPMVLFVPPSEREETARRLWESGPPPIDPGAVGLPVYSFGGDPRVRWGADTFPHGVLVVVDLPDSAMLHVGRQDSAQQDAVLEAVAAQATRDAETEEAYAARLRVLLLERGIRAIARYDHVAKQLNKPQELILLDPAASLKIIREAVPSFLRGHRPVYLLPHERPVQAGTAPAPAAVPEAAPTAPAGRRR